EIDGGARETVVAGNYIGTDVSGTVAVSNRTHGVLIDDARYNTVGGSLPGAGNVISGNVANGVEIRGGGNNLGFENTVAGNLIGTDRTGTLPLGNTRGVYLSDKAHNNFIGTNGDGVSDNLEGNTIAFNVYEGVGLANQTAIYR